MKLIPQLTFLASLSMFCMGDSGQMLADEWETRYESSHFTETERYDETVAYCQKLADASPITEYRSFGVSPQGRELPLLLIDAARNPDAPLFLIMAGIHAGEIDGKDAGLTLLRDVLVRNRYPGLLDHIRIAFVPIFNVDGHERFSAFSRSNQIGPKEMGWRTTAQNLNLNRDWLKADAPEMRAMLRLITELDPDFLADLHVTDGADFQYVITYSFGVYENELPPLRHYNRDRFLPAVKDRLKEAGYDFVPYSFFRRDFEVESGIELETYEPRFSNGYGTVINRPSILIETHSLKDYHTRVTATYEFLKAAITTITNQSSELRETVHAADSLAASLSGKQYALQWKLTPDSVMTVFRGVDYEFVPSEISGGKVVRWGKAPHTYHVPLFESHEPTTTVTAPHAYIVPWQWFLPVEDVIRAHGLRFDTLTQSLSLPVETYSFANVHFSPRSYERRFHVEYVSSTMHDTIEFPAGSVIIPLDQPRAQVAVHLLEPDGPDSFLKWGFMSQIFEQKEYIEPYVADTLATRMLAESEQLREEFRNLLATDSAFASSPEARYQFFYKRSPYWDTAMNRYPIGRITSTADLEYLRIVRAVNTDR